MAITRIFTRNRPARPQEQRELGWERPANTIVIRDGAGHVLHQRQGKDADDAGEQFNHFFEFLLACGYAEEVTASLADATAEELDFLLDSLPMEATVDLVCQRCIAKEPDNFHAHYVKFIRQVFECEFGERDDEELARLKVLAASFSAFCLDRAVVAQVPPERRHLIPRALGLIAKIEAMMLQAEGRLDQLDRIIELYRTAAEKRPDDRHITIRLEAAVAEQRFVAEDPATAFKRAARLAANIDHPDRSRNLNTVYSSDAFAAWLDGNPAGIPAKISSRADNKLNWVDSELKPFLSEKAIVNRFRAIDLAAKKAGTPVDMADFLHVCCEHGIHRGITFALAHTPMDAEALPHASDGKTIELLLARGADPNAPDGCGYPPLLRRKTKLMLLRLLVAGGMDVNLRSTAGDATVIEEFGAMTLFQQCMPESEKSYGQHAFDNAILMLTALVENGADPNLPSGKGFSARDIAGRFAEHGKLFAVLDQLGVTREETSNPGEGPIDVPALKRIAEAQLAVCTQKHLPVLRRLWEAMPPRFHARKERVTPQQLLEQLGRTMPEVWPRLTAALLQLGLPASVVFDPKERINLHVGDLMLESLDDPGTLVVLGDLRVKSFNDTELGSQLIVTGSMIVDEDMHTEGWVYIQGDLQVAGVLYGRYEDKALYVDGKVRAHVIIEDRHATMCKDAVADAYVTIDDSLNDRKWRKIFVPEAFELGDQRRLELSWNALMDLRNQGKPLLRVPDGRTTAPKTTGKGKPKVAPKAKPKVAPKTKPKPKARKPKR